MPSNSKRIFLGAISCLGLLILFLLQHKDWASYIVYFDESIHRFIWNRTVRFIINDFLAVLLVYALFPQRKYVVFAIGVQLAGLLFLLIPYFLLKLTFPAYNGPLINFLHRIILNPTLILLLIPAFYWQKKIINTPH